MGEGVAVIQRDYCLLHAHRIWGNDGVIDNCFRIRKTLSWKTITPHLSQDVQSDLIFLRNIFKLKHYKILL